MNIADSVELEASINYLKQYMIVNNTIEQKINKHAKRYKIAPNVCAWYCNYEDFCEDWCDNCGYSRTEARKLLHGGRGEFLVLENGNILRFSL